MASKELFQKIKDNFVSMLWYEPIQKWKSNDAKSFRAISLNTQRSYNSQAQIEKNWLKKPWKVTFKILRQIASRDALIRICVNVIKKAVSQADWTIQVKKNAPWDPKTDYEKEKKTCYDLFEYMNMNWENMRIVLDRILEDILILDAWAIEIIKSLDWKKIKALNSVDWATIRPVYNKYWELGTPAYKQLIYDQVVGEFNKEDMIYIMANPQNDVDLFWYWMSPIESILLQVQAALEADMFNIKHFTKDNVPPGILDLWDMNSDQAEEFIATWNATVIGNPHSLKFVRGSAQDKKFIPFNNTNKDMQYVEYINWLSKIKLATYWLSTIDANILQDLNRSTWETMRALSNARWVKSTKKLIEEYFTRNVIRCMEEDNEKYLQLEFKFNEDINVDVQLKQAQVDEIYITTWVAVPNEIRAREWKDPLDEPTFAEQLWNNIRQAQWKGGEPTVGWSTPKLPKPAKPTSATDQRWKAEWAKQNKKRKPYNKNDEYEDDWSAVFQKDLYNYEDL